MWSRGMWQFGSDGSRPKLPPKISRGIQFWFVLGQDRLPYNYCRRIQHFVASSVEEAIRAGFDLWSWLNNFSLFLRLYIFNCHAGGFDNYYRVPLMASVLFLTRICIRKKTPSDLIPPHPKQTSQHWAQRSSRPKLWGNALPWFAWKLPGCRVNATNPVNSEAPGR